MPEPRSAWRVTRVCVGGASGRVNRPLVTRLGWGWFNALCRPFDLSKPPQSPYGLRTESAADGRNASEGEMPIVNRIADLHGEITAWRHDLHAHPELLYDVHRTAAAVAEKLSAFGCDEVVTGIGRTGVVGLIRGSKGGDDHRVIGLRADMDALPIE